MSPRKRNLVLCAAAAPVLVAGLAVALIGLLNHGTPADPRWWPLAELAVVEAAGLVGIGLLAHQALASRDAQQ